MERSPRHPAVPDLDAESAATLLRALFETGTDAVGISRRGVIEVINPALLALFGYERESELLGRMVLELFTPESRLQLGEAMRRREVGLPVPGVYEARAVRRDGSEFDVEVRTTTYYLHGEAYALGILRDVSAQRLAARAQEREQQIYRAMFEINSAIKLLIDPGTGHIVDANAAAEEFYGWSRDTLRTMRISEINTLGVEEVAAEMEEARARRRGYFRFRHRTARGEIRHVEVRSGPIEVDGRGLLFSIVQDVTERDVLEDQLRQAQRLEAIGRLAGGVAHDFNNLLTVMLSCCHLLEGAVSVDNGRAQSALRDLNHAAMRASELSRQLLAFSRRQLLRPSRLCLNEVLLAMEGLLRRSLGTRVTMNLALEDGLPRVRADPGQMEQVVMNLVLNARDAMPNGGVLTLRTALHRTSADDAVDKLATGPHVALSVTDTGAGMDAETLSRVFEPFFTTKSAGHGTGLGLATAYGIVAQSGGQIFAHSRLGIGSEFLVLLPVADAVEEGVPSPENAPSKAARVCKVLLVEDMEDLRRILASELTDAGFCVHEANSAEAALALGEQVIDDIDLLLSDIVMPGKSGIDLAATLLSRRPDLLVLLISGDVRNHDKTKLPPHVRFLQKPFASSLLLDELRGMLDAWDHPNRGAVLQT